MIVLIVLPTAVFAHSDLLEASPAPGAMVGTDIAEISLLFSEPVGIKSEILLFGEGFQLIPVTTSLNLSNTANLVAFIEQPLAVGAYSVQYTAVSADGHEITGSYQFQVNDRTTPFALSTNTILLFLTFLLGTGFFFIYHRSRKNQAK